MHELALYSAQKLKYHDNEDRANPLHLQSTNAGLDPNNQIDSVRGTEGGWIGGILAVVMIVEVRA